MRSHIRATALASFLSLTPAFAAHFHVAGEHAGAWPGILSSVGITEGTPSNVFVIREGQPAPERNWSELVEQGSFLILEGNSATAASFGFRPSKKKVRTRSIVDLRSPKLPIIWEKTLELAVVEVPAHAQVFAKERWEGAPVLAGYKKGRGAVLWAAASPGEKGFERFPYILQALTDLGLELPLRSNRLWAFFDSSYRTRVDVDYFAQRWRSAGISALHVAAWHYHEPDVERDAYLRKLIEACHRHGILVYAWLELPHVSEKFWQDHPEWREKTALLQDAHLDWRKLMNLNNRDCFRTVAAGMRALVDRFDWDGVNLAELYFESLEGHGNPARFTPMNDDVRRAYEQKQGIDPLKVFEKQNAAEMQEFLDFRAELARKMQTEWIGELEAIRRTKRHLDLVLTHVDDRFDTRMKDLIGADAARLLPMLESHDFTFLIEDPATVWHLGPERYPEIASRYEPLTRRAEKLAIDINIVERYQDVYPTKQQTGTELFQLVHLAARAFPRVALYFENSIMKVDYPLLPASAAVVTRHERTGEKLIVDSPRGVGVAWSGGALVNGKLWPVADGKTVWLPAGPHVLEPSLHQPKTRLVDFNGELKSARVTSKGIEFTYSSASRAIALFDIHPASLEIDGVAEKVVLQNGALMLPRGQHLVSVVFE